MRKHINRLQSLFLLFSILVLTACGGGGGSSPIDGGGTTTEEEEEAGSGSIFMQLLQDASDDDSDITSISESNPGVIVVDLTDANGDAVSGEIVSLSTTIGTLSQSTALTDALGRAEIVVTADGSSAAGTIAASTEDLAEVELNFEIVSEGTVSTAGFSIVAGLYDSAVDLDDLAGSTQISSVSTVGSGFFVVTVTDAITGNPVDGVIVTLATTDGQLTPSSGQVLTNSNGIAAAEIEAAGADAGAAATLSATLEDVSASINFAFGSVDLQLGRDANDFVDPDDIDFVDGEIDIDLTGELSSNGTTVLTVVAVSSSDTAVGFDTPLTVNFSSNCSSAGTSTIDTGITTVNGIAEATYTAAGCDGEDDITATIEELSGVTATGSLTVQSPTATSIQFESATPTEISLQGTGDDQSTLVFKVLSGSGADIAGETVTMSLSTTIGGIALTGDADEDGTITEVTNATGEVSAVVNAGSVPTSVRVEASFVNGDGETVSTVSDSLVISTGLPDQNSFVLVAEVLNPGGDNLAGISDTLTVFASDAYNNPVKDGTTINFVTEYSTVGATCTTSGGVCNQTWTSVVGAGPDNTNNTGVILTVDDIACDTDGDFVPDAALTGVPCFNPLSYQDTEDLDNDGSTTDYIVGNVYGGRNTILAFAIGEESFVDANGSGFYDWIDDGDGVYEDGETLEEFVDLPEAFHDHNEDGVFGNFLTGCSEYDGDSTAVNSLTDPLGEDQCSGARTGGQEEEFFDFIDNDAYDGDQDGDTDNGSSGNGIYNGTLCHPDLAAFATPRCTTDLVHVRDETVVIQSAGGSPRAAVYTNADGFTQAYTSPVVYAGSGVAPGSTDIDASSGESVVFVLSDRFNGLLPFGTTIDITTDNCTLTTAASYTIGSSSALGPSSYTIGLRQDEGDENTSGTVSITVTVPVERGGTTPLDFSFACLDEDSS